MYHKEHGAKIFESEDEFEQAGKGWVDTPAKFEDPEEDFGTADLEEPEDKYLSLEDLKVSELKAMLIEDFEVSESDLKGLKKSELVDLVFKKKEE
tara:strand:- start:18454 stop:18738 length:285 start_codon:yes stop_codon:yes gene_type:complete